MVVGGRRGRAGSDNLIKEGIVKKKRNFMKKKIIKW